MKLGAIPAGILLYLRTLMRSMQSPEIQITIPELAHAAGVPEYAAESALRAIAAAGYLIVNGAQAAQAAGQRPALGKSAARAAQADGSLDAEQEAIQ